MIVTFKGISLFSPLKQLQEHYSSKVSKTECTQRPNNVSKVVGDIKSPTLSYSG